MNSRVILLLMLWIGGWGISLRGQKDFLTPRETDSVRDAQEPSERIILYLELAQRRLDAVQKGLASKKSKAGRAAQKNLDEFISILDALEGTLEDAREKRSSAGKALKEMKKQGLLFLRYLQALQLDSSAPRSDYRFTLEEAIDTTRDVLAQAQKGSFPEVRERQPPTQFPAVPPPSANRSGREEGPPRKRGRAPSRRP